jgi:hypothetical protein
MLDLNLVGLRSTVIGELELGFLQGDLLALRLSRCKALELRRIAKSIDAGLNRAHPSLDRIELLAGTALDR